MFLKKYKNIQHTKFLLPDESWTLLFLEFTKKFHKND